MRTRMLLTVAIFVTVGWLLLVATLSLQETSLIFLPSRTINRTPANLGLTAEELSIAAANGVTLHGWWIRSGSNQTAIWYHGNAGNISHRLANAQRLIDELHIDVVLVDYRGYGNSTGSPEEDGLYRDGTAIYDTVRRRGVPATDIILFGRSLGAAIAIETALRRPAGKLVLESAFRSIPALARQLYWFVPSRVVRTQLDNESKIHRIDIPLLVLHGENDRLIPIQHGRELFRLAREPKTFHQIRGAGHNDTWTTGGTSYWNAWRTFLSAERVPQHGSQGDGAYRPHTATQRPRE